MALKLRIEGEPKAMIRGRGTGTEYDEDDDIKGLDDAGMRYGRC